MGTRIFSLGLALLLILAIQMSAESLIWDFNVKSEADDWVALSGDWEVDAQEGVFIASSDFDEGTAIVSEDVWNDEWVNYTIEAKVRNMGSENHFGIGFRDDGAGNHYGFYLNDTADGKFWFGTFNGGYSGLAGNWVDDCDCPDAEAWNVLKVVVEDFDFELYVNDQLLTEVSDAGEMFGSGPVALVSDKNVLTAVAQFDYVKIEGEGIPSAVSSQDKLTTTWGELKANTNF